MFLSGVDLWSAWLCMYLEDCEIVRHMHACYL